MKKFHYFVSFLNIFDDGNFVFPICTCNSDYIIRLRIKWYSHRFPRNRQSLPHEVNKNKMTRTGQVFRIWIKDNFAKNFLSGNNKLLKRGNHNFSKIVTVFLWQSIVIFFSGMEITSFKIAQIKLSTRTTISSSSSSAIITVSPVRYRIPLLLDEGFHKRGKLKQSESISVTIIGFCT